MSALFPHDAVVQRYLHTGGSGRSPRKLVLVSFLSGVACAVLFANLPAGSLTGRSSASVPQTAVKGSPDIMAQAPAGEGAPHNTTMTANTTMTTAGAADAHPATTGSVSRPDAAPPPANSVAAPASAPVPAPPAVPPPAQASALSAPPAAAAQTTPVPAAEVDTLKSAAAETVQEPPHKAAPKKVAHGAYTKRQHAEQRARAARRQEARARAVARRQDPDDFGQPPMARMFETQNGQQAYQRLPGDAPGLAPYGGQRRRVYLLPMNGDID